MILKLQDELRGEHVHTRIYMGVDEEHLQLTGTLIMDIGQWEMFNAALLLGAGSMNEERKTQILGIILSKSL